MSDEIRDWRILFYLCMSMLNRDTCRPAKNDINNTGHSLADGLRFNSLPDYTNRGI